ncbi:MAG: glycosyltransferase family 2 protein [Alphaproteobacteria bacterium]|nr:glycosyltransferase family 2 protein [Alphaproteobacteria bacterium]
MKLIVQIPCYNEAETLESVISTIPKRIEGIDKIETLIIDDGSTDGTSELAKKIGVTHIIRHAKNKGLARSFHRGIDECLKRGADIIVNTDGDNQYDSADIAKLVAPVVRGEADIVVGDRGGMDNPHFSTFKKRLQVFGSWVIGKMVGYNIPDAVSGFRAISRDAAQRLNIVSDFSYTIEMLVIAGARRMAVISVPINTNGKTRESRLFKSIPYFLKMSVSTLLRMYTMHSPLRVFLVLGGGLFFIGALPIVRFLFYYFGGDGGGHIQSLIIGGTLCMLGFMTLLAGVLADLVHFNRRLLEKALYKIHRLECELDRTQ